MHEFARFHPIVSFIYFFAIIAFSMVFMHPLCIAISLIFGLSYMIVQKGRRAVFFSLVLLLPILVLTALLNPLFNHAGMTILTYLPSGNPVTLESLLYGICAAGMLTSVICHFSNFGATITGDKFLCLFGFFAPSLALVISMAFRFVPLFIREIRNVSDAQKALGKSSEKNALCKAKAGVRVLSVVITKSLENAVELAASMKSRGYGSGRRTSFSNYRFTSRDGTLLGGIVLLSGIIILRSSMGAVSAEFFPKILFSGVNRGNIEFFISYFILAVLPIIIEIKEVWRWKKSESKI